MICSPEHSSDARKTLLITGFDPFGGSSVNPAWEAVRRLPDVIGGAEILKRMVPTVYKKAADEVLKAAEECHPSAIILVGQAGGRACVTPERVALNLAECAAPDNEGTRILSCPILPEGPAALFDTLGAYDLVSALKAEGYRAALSYSAGTFVCNELFYRVSYAMGGTGVRVGFIHVPYLPEQAPENMPSMEPEEIVSTLKRCCELVASKL